MQIAEHLTDFSAVQCVISVVHALQFKRTKNEEGKNIIFICKILITSRTQTSCKCCLQTHMSFRKILVTFLVAINFFTGGTSYPI